MKFLDYLWNILVIYLYKVRVGKDFRCEGRLVIQGRGGYGIGDHVHIISKEFLNPVGGNRTVLQTLDKGRILIGSNVGISHAILCARESIIIEDDVLIGGGVKIYDNDFHAVEYAYRIERPDKHIKKAEVRIGQGAFIGAHSIILKGVEIGKYAVIGAGSVVTKNVPDNEVWAGNPAKKVKSLLE